MSRRMRWNAGAALLLLLFGCSREVPERADTSRLQQQLLRARAVVENVSPVGRPSAPTVVHARNDLQAELARRKQGLSGGQSNVVYLANEMLGEFIKIELRYEMSGRNAATIPVFTNVQAATINSLAYAADYLKSTATKRPAAQKSGR